MTAVGNGAKPGRREATELRRNRHRLEARVASEQARADLVATLNALEDKANVPKQLARAARQARERAGVFVRAQPVAAIAIGVGVVAGVGGAVWLLAGALFGRRGRRGQRGRYGRR